MKSWWAGDKRVEQYMAPVKDAITRHLKERTPEWTDVYNRAYEAVYQAIKDQEPKAIKATEIPSNVVAEAVVGLKETTP